MKELKFLCLLALFGCQNVPKDENSPFQNESEELPQEDDLSFDEQLNTFNQLGYELNEGISKEVIFDEIKDYNQMINDVDSLFKADPYSLLYYYLGWYNNSDEYYTNQCIWYDLEFIDSRESYKEFMKRMGTITNGEITFTNIEVGVDDSGYEWIQFTVNGVEKKWKLEKEDYIDDSFFYRFSLITEELKTKGGYTVYDDGGQQFVIDYATDEEQKEFVQVTGLKREWLGDGNHFSEPSVK